MSYEEDDDIGAEEGHEFIELNCLDTLGAHWLYFRLFCNISMVRI